jgi:hypothetical protein
MEALKARLTSMLGQLFSQSPLPGAINYALNHWDGLTLFLDLRGSSCRLHPMCGEIKRARVASA